MAKRKTDHCIVDWFRGRSVLKCTKCGKMMPMPLGDIAFFSTVIKAFGKAHAKCDGSPDVIRASVDLVAFGAKPISGDTPEHVFLALREHVAELVLGSVLDNLDHKTQDLGDGKVLHNIAFTAHMGAKAAAFKQS